MKTVSVVMCTYNGEKYLREQLDSIINQTYPIHEIIIQDDCSTDGTVAIIEEYQKKYSNIKLYINEHNLGFNENFKTAVMRATGDYIAISDQDDVWFPEKIESQIKTIGNNSLCGSYLLSGESLETAGVWEYQCTFERTLFNNMVGHTFLCKAEFIQDEKNWIQHIWYDWGLMINAYLNNGVTLVERPLCWHRRHPNEVTWSENTHNSKFYQPYLYGMKRYKSLQKKENWIRVYSYIYGRTSKDFYPVVHEECRLLLKSDFYSFLRLCLLCYRNRKNIYIGNNTKGFMGAVRSFFFPLIYAYNPNVASFKYRLL